MSHTEMKSTSPTHAKGGSNVDMINKAATKLCQIVKRDDFDGYGFNLHSEKAKPGQFIGKVDANSPAEMAGLKEGDRIIEVNGVAINNETHKQVVQRIKAIACEVRLLLVDVDGKGDGGQPHMLSNGNGQTMETTSSTKTEQILPGASENINSITMVSTKRPSSQASHNSGDTNNSMDVTDKATAVTGTAQQQEIMMNRNSGSNVPPPPSATMASANKPLTMSMAMMNHSNSSSNSHNNSISSTTTMSSNGATVATHAMETTTASSSSSGGNGNGNTTTNKAGSLQLPMTAAEMRAKLMMKKKYDPKNESVDLKKKYEIVQKL